MKIKPKISVIVPVYNTGKYLSKCLTSILNQTFIDFELIVVNDGSTDDSQAIIEDFYKKDPRIKFIQKENGGLSDARNKGIDLAEGDYISFIDSDDYIDMNMFEEMYSLAKKYDSEIVICDLVKVNEKNIEFRLLTESPQLPECIKLEDDFTIFGEMSCFACNKIFKRELFSNKRFKKGIHFEDIELIPQLFLESRIVGKINKPFYKYFERQNSITQNYTEKGLDMFIAVDNVTECFYKSRYANQLHELKRFQILQMYFSYLAYVAYIEDRNLKREMLDKLKDKMYEFKINKKEILSYTRFNENYIFSLPFKKKIYYLLSFTNLVKYI